MKTDHKTMEELKEELQETEKLLSITRRGKRKLKHEIEQKSKKPIHVSREEKGLGGIIESTEERTQSNSSGKDLTSGLDRESLEIADHDDPGVDINRMTGLEAIVENEA